VKKLLFWQRPPSKLPILAKKLATILIVIFGPGKQRNIELIGHLDAEKLK